MPSTHEPITMPGRNLPAPLITPTVSRQFDADAGSSPRARVPRDHRARGDAVANGRLLVGSVWQPDGPGQATITALDAVGNHASAEIWVKQFPLVGNPFRAHRRCSLTGSGRSHKRPFGNHVLIEIRNDCVLLRPLRSLTLILNSKSPV